MGFLAGSVFSLWLISGIWSEQAVTFQPLNMSVNAFDDQYEGCTENMKNIVNQSLLAEEKNADKVFRINWNNAAKRWETHKPNVSRDFPDEYGIALLAYTRGSDLYSNFNAAVRDYKGRDNFKYHSLHFLLTQAVKFLAPRRNKATTLYRGMKGIHLKQKKGEKVRFGQFASSSECKENMTKFGDDTFFTFTSYFGASLKNYSYIAAEEEVLIPVDEVFEVTSFKEEGGKSRFVLKDTKQRCHYYNCDYIKKGGKSSTCVPSKGML